MGLVLWFKYHLQLCSLLLNTFRIHTVCCVYKVSRCPCASWVCRSLWQGGYVFNVSVGRCDRVQDYKLLDEFQTCWEDGERAKRRTHWMLVQSWTKGRIQDLFSAVNKWRLSVIWFNQHIVLQQRRLWLHLLCSVGFALRLHSALFTGTAGPLRGFGLSCSCIRISKVTFYYVEKHEWIRRSGFHDL